MFSGLFWDCGRHTCCPSSPSRRRSNNKSTTPAAAVAAIVTTTAASSPWYLRQRRHHTSSSTVVVGPAPSTAATTTTTSSLLRMGATVSNAAQSSTSSCSPSCQHHHQQSSAAGLTQLGSNPPNVCPGTSTATACLPVGNVAGQPQPLMRERRKKTTGFATLRKKFIRRRRSSKSCDHSRVLRDFVSDWTPVELSALLDEYESLSALKDLAVQAELARPPAATFKQDLSALYDSKHCTDCELVFRGTIFPVHRALLSARCTYFRDLLAGCPGYGARICLELRSSPIDVPMFSALLRYLYTGDLCPHEQSSIDLGILKRLGDDFGNPNPLENDLKYLLETGDYADAALIFTADGGDFQRPDSGSSEYGFRPKLELPCHKAILSARSPFFRNLIQRRSRTAATATGTMPLDNAAPAADMPGPSAAASGTNAAAVDPVPQQTRALHVPTRIVLDETVIPKRYARVLLHAIYMDTVDLSLILRGNGCDASAGSLGEVQALTQNGRARLTPLEEAMELYQIGRFLELDILSQGCEDLILEWLKLETLPTVLRWASQPHGSAWVYRQSCHFLREEFSAISASPVLHQLEKGQLITALQSNFLQASELEVLQAVLKWGEQELIRRMEDREPNILNNTTHSVTRKGVKKRDLSDVELREILSELLPLVRMDHVLPPNSDVLTQAIRRGLVSTPPSHMIGDERENLRVNAWIRTQHSNNGLFVRPRLFMPYFEEVKQLLEDHLATTQQLDMLRVRMSRHMPDIPDTLYMVSRLGSGGGASGGNGSGMGSGGQGASGAGGMAGSGSGNIELAALPAPDSATMQAMVKREVKLRQSPSCQRAMALSLSSKHEINRQIRLRVVREFNFPDPVSDLLETASCYCVEEGHSNRADVCGSLPMDMNLSAPPSPAIPQVPGMAQPRGLDENPFGNLTFGRHAQQQQQPQYHHPAHLSTLMRQPLPSLVQDGELGAMCADTSGSSSSSIYGRLAHGGGGGVGAMGLSGRRISHEELEMAHSCPDGGMGHLSDIMPDVAMATASMGQLQLGGSAGGVGGPMAGGHMEGPDSLQLDLGDGSSHLGAVGLNHMHHHSMQHHHNLHASSSYHHYMRGAGGGSGPLLSPYAMHRHSPAAGSSGSIAGGGGSASGGSSSGGPSTSSSYHTGPPRFL